MTTPANKIIFANQLRGIAALAVVITHYFAVFFGAQPSIAAFTFSPNLQFQPPPWTDLLYFPNFNFGPFGVAVFFLISGFVIPFSISTLAPRRFLIARIFRIYPTYIACLCISTLALWISAHLYGTAFLMPRKAWLANALLLHTAMGISSVDLVNWTLSIEIKFYLLMALGGALVLRRRTGLWLLGYALFVVGLTVLLQKMVPSRSVIISRTLTLELDYLSFMSIGILFYQHHKGQLKTWALLVQGLGLGALFVAGWYLSAERQDAIGLWHNYAYGLLLFSAAYAARGFFRRFWPLDFLADISFPLYLVHSLSGYVAMKWLMQNGVSFDHALPLTFVCACYLAWLIHYFIELPTARLGRTAFERRPRLAPVVKHSRELEKLAK